MKTIGREDIARAVSDRMDLRMKESREMTGRLLEIMCDSLSSGETLKITGFGTFQPVMRAARKGRNPRTGESVNIPARKRIIFKASRKLKEALIKAPPTLRPSKKG